MDVRPIGSSSAPISRPTATAPPAKNVSFGQVAKKLVREVSELQREAEGAARDFALGRTEAVHKVMLKIAKAELGFQFLLEVRNKLLEAYREVQRMQV